MRLATCDLRYAIRDMSLWRAIRDGFTAATRIPAPFIVTFLVILAGALVLTVPVVAAMDAWVGNRLVIGDLARNFNGWRLVESLLSGAATLQAGTPISPGILAESRAVATTLVTMIGTALVAWLASSFPGIVLGGGVLLTYAEGRFAWRHYLWGVWHWLSAFLAFSILFALCAAFVTVLGVGTLIVLQTAKAGVWIAPALGVVGLVYVVLAMTFDYARAIAVVGGTRNVFRALGQALTFLVRQPIPAFGLYLLMSAVGLALIPLYSSVVAPVIPFAWWLVAIVAQQLFIAGRLWVRLSQLASEVALYKQSVGRLA